MQLKRLYPFFALSVALLFAQQAFSQSVPRIYVVPPQVVEEEGSRAIGGSLNTAILAAIGDQPLLLLSPKISSESDADLDALEKKFKEAEEMLESDPEQAISIVRKVLGEYEASIGTLDDFEIYLKTLVKAADAYLYAGYEDAFVNAVIKFAALRPEAEVPSYASEELGTSIQLAQERNRKTAQARASIVSNESLFFLQVDGKEIENTSAPVSLLPGTHFVIVSAPGKKIYSEKIELKAGEITTITATLLDQEEGDVPKAVEKAGPPPRDLVQNLKKGVLDTEVRKMAVRLAQKAQADWVLMPMVARDESQYKIYPYLLQAKDASVILLSSANFLPGPPSALSNPASQVILDLVKVTYTFPKDKAIPAAPAIVVIPKGPPVNTAVLVDNTLGSGVKVDPYSIDISALSTDAGSDKVLEAPPDARGDGAKGDGGYVVLRYPEGSLPPVYYGNVAPVGPTPQGVNKAPRRTVNPYVPRPPREPITFASIRQKWWFWPVIGVAAAGALGAGASTIIRPRGLEGVVSWP